MSQLNLYSLYLSKASTQKNFLSRSQIIERKKSDKQINNSTIQQKKISKPQSVQKLAISKISIAKPMSTKKTFSCSKLQLNELIPDYQCFFKRKESENQPFNSDYFNFVQRAKVAEQLEDNQLHQLNKMKEELLKSFRSMEEMLKQSKK